MWIFCHDWFWRVCSKGKFDPKKSIKCSWSLALHIDGVCSTLPLEVGVQVLKSERLDENLCIHSGQQLKVHRSHWRRYVGLILKLVLVLSWFIRLLLSSLLPAVSEQLIDYWKRSRESHGSSSLHLRNNLNNIIGAVSEEFDPKLTENPGRKYEAWSYGRW